MIGFLENEEILSIFEFRYKSNNTQYVRGKQGHMIHFSEGKSFSVDELYDRFYNELVLWADTIWRRPRTWYRISSCDCGRKN